MTNAPVSDTDAQLLRALTSLRDLRGRLERAEGARTEPIAIIGMGCRLPGAADPHAFWELLRSGGDAIRETPADRWDTDGIYDPAPDAAGKVATRWGGFLDRIDHFDAAFFGISPREAAQMDPQQRLLLEVAWETLEDGGQAIERLAGSATGVFVGVHSHSGDYYLMQAADPRRLDLYSGTGTSHSVVSGRLSYLLDLRGPSLAIDTACSSSLVAVHLAVQSLRNGECSLALAGGVNSIIDPTFTMVASRMRMMSASGRCRPFDARGDGFVRSEGCAAVLLKRLSDAVSDGDRILAVINGSAVNQDGRSNGLTAPNSLSQQAVIREALTNAGVSARDIGYVETHGTGTPLGDPIEIEALTEVFGNEVFGSEVFAGKHGATQSCALGSAKANIGHTEGAAGVAALIKAVLTLGAGEIPPLVHFEQLNPHITLDGTPFVIPTSPLPWTACAQPRYAGVSSFGWSGTNVHVIVGEAPTAALAGTDRVAADTGPFLLPISARSQQACRDLAVAFRSLLADDSTAPLGDICASAGVRRSHHDHRVAVAGRNRDELVAQLDAFIAGDEHRGLSAGGADARPHDLLVFVFPGQGSQWPGMARQLMATEPEFRDAIERCQQSMAPFVDWSLVEQLSADRSRIDDIDDIDVIQPVLFAIQVALAALWRARGVQPDAVVGHSMGEIAAAHIAGILSLADAACIICRRSQLLRRIRGQGAMAVVELDIDQARQAIAGLDDRLAIAVSNSQTSTVLSGDPAALDEVMSRLDDQGIFCRRVKVDVASHSPQVDQLHDDLVDALAGIRPQRAAIPFFSTVTARFEDGPDLGAQYWASNLRQPVLFAEAVQQLIGTEHARFVELSPHPVLLAAVQESLDRSGRHGATISSMQRDADEPVAMHAALGALYADGYPVDWARLHGGRRPAADLPMYPWQRERHWLDGSTAAAGRRGRQVDPLLGWHVPIADANLVRVWENSLERRDLPILFEQRIGGVPILPSSALVELMLRAAAACGREGLTDVRFEHPTPLADDEPTATQVVLDPAYGADGAIAVYSSNGEVWTRHAAAMLGPAATTPAETPAAIDSDALDALRARTAAASGERVYRELHDSGLELGPGLQCVTQVWVAEDQLVAEITGDADGRDQLVTIEACLQVGALAGAGGPGLPRGLFMPVSARAVQRHGIPTARMTCVVTMTAEQDGATSSTRRADVVLSSDSGQVIATIEDLLLQGVDTATERIEDWIYGIAWRLAAGTCRGRPEPIGTWLVFADRRGYGDSLARELRSTGARCVTVGIDAEFSRPGPDEFIVRPDRVDDVCLVLDDVARDSVEVVFLWGLDAPSGNPSSAAELELAQLLSCTALLNLTTAMTRSGHRAPIWAVTKGVHCVRPGDDGAAIVQAPIWGLGRVVAEELPEMWGGLVDLDPAAGPEKAARSLARELTSSGGDDAGSDAAGDGSVEGEVALRETRYVSRLVRQAVAEATPLKIRPDSTCLVTGGFGAVGRHVAQWLVAEGARRIILLGRTALPPRDTWDRLGADTPAGRRVALVQLLERRGAAVHLAAVDVGDEVALRAYLDQFRAEGWPPIRAVFHAAAVFGGELIDQLDRAALREQMMPKVIGAWTLSEVFGSEVFGSEALDELDHFVMFSSVGALLPMAGQGAYAAANAFLDAIAHRRAAQGRSGLSVNWGFWGGSNEALAGEVGQRRGAAGPGFKDTAKALTEAQGMRGFRTEQGLEVLRRLMLGSAAQAVVVPIDWAAFGALRIARPLALVADLIEEQSRESSATEAAGSRVPSLVEQLAAVPAAERDDLVEAALRRLVGRVLKLPESRIDSRQSFGTLGLDSLMSIELRNRLEAEFGFKLSATVAWNYPTVNELGAYVLSRINETPKAAEQQREPRGDGLPTEPSPGTTPSVSPSGVNQSAAVDLGLVAAEVAELTDDEVLSALIGKGQR